MIGQTTSIREYLDKIYKHENFDGSIVFYQVLDIIVYENGLAIAIKKDISPNHSRNNDLLTYQGGVPFRDPEATPEEVELAKSQTNKPNLATKVA